MLKERPSYDEERRLIHEDALKLPAEFGLRVWFDPRIWSPGVLESWSPGVLDDNPRAPDSKFRASRAEFAV